MIAIIGCGNMAEAIVQGFHKKNKNISFLTYTPSFLRAESLAKKVSGRAVKNLIELQEASAFVIACKPQQLLDLSKNIKKAGLDLRSKHIISILAATPIEVLEKELVASRITRVMPNTPSALGLGMSLILNSKSVWIEDRSLVNDFFNACGEVHELNTEEEFDQVTTVASSGPAYVFLFAKTMVDKLTTWGISHEDSKKIVIQMFRGSSELMQNQNDLSLNELISKVTSKGGVTIEAIKSFKEGELGQLTNKALDAALARSSEITSEVLSKH